MTYNLTQACLEASVSANSQKNALVFNTLDGGHLVFSYEKLWFRILGFAQHLKKEGLLKGDVVSLALPQGPAYAIGFFGVIAAGGVVLALSPQLLDSEVAALSLENQARFLIVGENRSRLSLSMGTVIKVGDRESFETSRTTDGLFSTEANDPAFVVFTSGTTKKPVGVLHAQRYLQGRKPMFSDWTNIQRDDVVFHAGELNWTYTLGVGLMDPWVKGATAVLCQHRPQPEEWFELIAKSQATHFATVPSLYRRILKYSDPRRMSQLKYGLSAGEVLSPEIREAWEKKTGTPIYEAFGMSEMSTFISQSPNTERKPGSCGRLQGDRKALVLTCDEEGRGVLRSNEVGVLAIDRHDPGFMLQYTQSEYPCVYFENRWFVTSDLMRVDEEGHFWYHGRCDDVVKCQGYRLSPLEIESVIAAHPLIEEAAFVVLERQGVQVPCIFVVAKEKRVQKRIPKRTDKEWRDDILAYAREHLIAFKVPKEVIVVKELPRNRNGKLDRRRLKGENNE